MGQGEPVDKDSLITVFSDDFEDFPGINWLGEQIRFEPEIRSGKRFLRQIGDPGQNSHYLLTRNNVYYGEWKFSVIFDGFTSSNQNRVWIWLMADDDELPVGYGIRLGENGSDKFVRLFQLRGELPPVEMLQSNRLMPGASEQIMVHVRRDPAGFWHLGVASASDTDYDWVSVSESDAPVMATYWFVFRTSFTATRSDKYLFGPVEMKKYPVFVRSVEALNERQIRIILSEPTQSLQEIQVYINDQPANGWITANGAEAVLNLDQPLEGGNHRIGIKGVFDQFTGKEVVVPEIILEIFQSPSRFDVVINEFLPRPLSNNTPLFFELYNRSDKRFDLTGWTFCRSSGNWTINSDEGRKHLLEPGEFVILTPNSAYFTSRGINNTISLPITTPLRTQDRFCLRDADGELIDSLAYNSAWSEVLVDGYSLEKLNPHYIGMDLQNWKSRATGNLGIAYESAGKTNIHQQSYPNALRVEHATEKNDGHIALLFSQFIHIKPQTTITINNRPVEQVEWDIWNGNTMRIGSLSPSDDNSAIHIMIDGLSIVGSDFSEHIHVEAGRIPARGNLLLNEIMYQPLQDRYGSYSDQSDYIEIRNLAPWRISLEDVFIHDTPDKNGQIRTWIPVNRANWQVASNGYAVLIPDTITTMYATRTPIFFGLSTDEQWARVNRTTLSLSSGGRGVYLATSGEVLDSVYYSPSWHHPLLSDPRGVSLEHTGWGQPGAPRQTVSDNPSRFWTSSAHTLGGTPGAPNTAEQRSVAINHPSEVLSITPNPFSPDLDGFDDIAIIKLNLPEAGRIARIQIFDRTGVLVKTLEDGVIVGSIFETTWNGLTRRNTLAETGVYLVSAELLDLQQRKTNTYIKPIVLVRGNRTRVRF